MVCLFGPNGAGKSTPLAILLGFTQPDAGEVWVGGEDVSPNPALARRKLAYVPEKVGLWRELTALEHVRVVKRSLGMEVNPTESSPSLGCRLVPLASQ